MLENLISYILNKDVDNKVMTEYQYHIDYDEYATCVMLASMSLKLMKLFHYKMTKGSPMNTYMLRMIGYFKEIRPIEFCHEP